MNAKYPEITVKLTGTDGNAHAVMSKVSGALKEGGVSQAEIAKFYRLAMSKDYDGLLHVVVRYVNVE